MILVFGFVVGLWSTLAGGLFPPSIRSTSIGEEQGLGVQEEQQQKCDHDGSLSQLISDNVTRQYHFYFVIISLE